MRPAIFLDRDGVINENRDDYVKSWQEVNFLPDVFDALKLLSLSAYRIILLTNQSVVGRGLLAESDLILIHKKMIKVIHRNGGRIDGIYYCPHHPDQDCKCRKPKPGLILKAAKKFSINLSQSYLVGDAESDMQTAINAGCNPVLVLTGRGREQLVAMSEVIRVKCHIANSLKDAAQWILEQTEYIQ